MNKSRGFTLVELLTVSSITIISAAVLIPVPHKARQDAQRLICESNIKAQFTIQITYASACGGRFPEHTDASPYYVRSWQTPDPNNHLNKYSRVYYIYSKGWMATPDILLCPILAAKFRNMTDGGDMFSSITGGGGAFTTWNGPKPASGMSYIGIPYCWFANYRFSGSYGVPGTPLLYNYKSAVPGKWSGFQVNEPPWPTKLADCTSSNAFIAHLICYDDGSYYWDASHGGSYLADAGSDNFDQFAGSQETNPVGYADGHVTWRKKSEVQPRACAAPGWEEYLY